MIEFETLHMAYQRVANKRYDLLAQHACWVRGQKGDKPSKLLGRPTVSESDTKTGAAYIDSKEKAAEVFKQAYRNVRGSDAT